MKIRQGKPGQGMVVCKGDLRIPLQSEGRANDVVEKIAAARALAGFDTFHAAVLAALPYKGYAPEIRVALRVTASEDELLKAPQEVVDALVALQEAGLAAATMRRVKRHRVRFWRATEKGHAVRHEVEP